MAKLVFAMNQSLDGYVDHTAFAPSPTLFRHFIEEVEGQAGSVYGRQMYEVMRYWDDDHPEWDAEEHAFAAAWRKQTKWVVSRSLKSVGPNAGGAGASGVLRCPRHPDGPPEAPQPYKRATGVKVEARKSHAELRPEVVSEAKRLCR